MSFKIKPLHAVDSYKLGHRPAYPAGTTEVYSNFTPRSVNHLNIPTGYKTNEIVWFGGQAVITDMIELWQEEFFAKDVESIIDEYDDRIATFIGPNDYPMDHIRDLHKLGYLPLEIKTLPEGSYVPVGVPVITIRNTDSRFAWLTNYLESYLSAELWKPSTSATIADYYRKIITKWADKTGGNKEFIDFMCHDFSYRGMSGTIDASKSGAGHLLSFKGTDSISAVDYLAYHYNGDETFVGASVPAMEHSIQCAYANDLEYVRHVVKDVYPNGIVSVVCDGYDYWNVLTEVLPQLKEEILSRGEDAMGFSKVVMRPDSGNPVDIICGRNFVDYDYSEVNADFEYLKENVARWVEQEISEETSHGEGGDSEPCRIIKFNDKYYTVTVSIMWNRYDKQYYYTDGSSLISIREYTPTVEDKGSIEVLWDIFGGTINEKGYKTLNQKIGLIYGDSITLERCEEILKRLEAKGFASDNIVLGIGSYTYQYNTRDTLGFAMKATNLVIDEEDVAIFKTPKTDNGTKKSAKGLLQVVKENGKYKLNDNVSRSEEVNSELTTLYKDGSFYKFETLEEIRARLAG